MLGLTLFCQKLSFLSVPSPSGDYSNCWPNMKGHIFQLSIIIICLSKCHLVSHWYQKTYKLYCRKQSLCRTQKLQRCTNWKVNLRICKWAKASNKKNWTVQLVCPPGTSSCSVQLVLPASPSNWSFRLVHPAGLSSICCKVHVLQSAKNEVSSKSP